MWGEVEGRHEEVVLRRHYPFLQSHTVEAGTGIDPDPGGEIGAVLSADLAVYETDGLCQGPAILTGPPQQKAPEHPDAGAGQQFRGPDHISLREPLVQGSQWDIG